MTSDTDRKIPTGIGSLDPVFEGGVPAGSVILLLGETGAGSNEFVYSSISGLASRQPLAGSPAGGLAIPQEIRYITFTRTKDDILGEMTCFIAPGNAAEAIRRIRFDDLSDTYFDSSIVPAAWYSSGDIITRLKKRTDRAGVLAQLAGVLDSSVPDSLVAIDSLTDIGTQCSTPELWRDFTGLLRGFQRMAKLRNQTVYLLLTKGILKEEQENEIADIVDAVFLFRWEETTGSRRQRIMFFEKFRGVMPHLVEQDLVKFAVRISTTGFEVSNIRVVI